MRRYEDIRIAIAVSGALKPSDGRMLELNRFFGEVNGFFHPLSACFIVADADAVARAQKLLEAAVFEDLRTGFDWVLWINSGGATPCVNGGATSRVSGENPGLRFLRDIVDFALDGNLDAAAAGNVLKGPDEAIKRFDFLLVSMKAVGEFCTSNPSNKRFFTDSAPGTTPEEIFCAWLKNNGFGVSHLTALDAAAGSASISASMPKPIHFPAGVVFLENPAGVVYKTLKNPASITLNTINAVKEAASLKSVALYGAGTVARALMPVIKNVVTLVVDASPELHGRDFFGLKVQPPDALRAAAKDLDAIIITPLGREREIAARIAKILGESAASIADAGGRTPKIIALDGEPTGVKNTGVVSSQSPHFDTVANVDFNDAGGRAPIDAGGRTSRPASIVKSSDLEKTTARTMTGRAVLYVGYPCNIKCIFCYYAHTPSKEWHTIDECKADALLYRSTYRNDRVDITGGEPTIYPHILELVEYCSKIGLTPTLITNMQALAKREKLEELKARGVYDFLCSVHALGDSYEFLTKKKGAWGNLLRAVENFQRLDMRWRVNCTMTAINRRQLTDIARFAYENGARVINFINYNPFHEWEAKMDIDFQSRHTEITPHLVEALDYCDGAGLEANVRYFPFCRMKGHEDKCYNFSQLSYDHHEWDFSSWYSDKTKNPSEKIPAAVAKLARDDDEGFRNFTARMMREKLFCQSRACRLCALDPICDGFSNQYASRFGMDETLPYDEPAVTDPAHFIRKQKKVVDSK